MPRLSPEETQARDREIESRILELWGYIPVVIDATKAELAEIQAEVEWWETHDEPPPGWTPDPPTSEEELIPLSNLIHRLNRDQKALELKRDVCRLYMGGKGIREIARRLKKPVTTIQRALTTVIRITGRRPDVRLMVHMEQCPVCSKRQRLCAVGEKKLNSEAGTHYQREKTCDNMRLEYEARPDRQDGHKRNRRPPTDTLH